MITAVVGLGVFCIFSRLEIFRLQKQVRELRTAFSYHITEAALSKRERQDGK